MLTREEAKRLSELYSAVAEGKAIQMRSLKTGKWVNVNANKNDIFSKDCDYRIKPKPKYRSFKNQEECWQEMLKHQPFGWLKSIKKQEKIHIGRVFEIEDDVLITLSINPGRNINSHYFFRTYTFADGTPFGIR